MPIICVSSRNVISEAVIGNGSDACCCGKCANFSRERRYDIERATTSNFLTAKPVLSLAFARHGFCMSLAMLSTCGSSKLSLVRGAACSHGQKAPRVFAL
eukprot:6188165-Pleurochrysis_carterae.AAC.1